MNIFDASVECARYIMDSDCEQVSYQEYVQNGSDPTRRSTLNNWGDFNTKGIL